MTKASEYRPDHDPGLPQQCARCGSRFYDEDGNVAVASLLIWRNGQPGPGCTACKDEE